MALIPAWNAFGPGVAFGCVGLVLAGITVYLWRKMEHKAPIRFTKKTLLSIFVGVLGARLLGVGMCMVMVYEQMLLGIVAGLAGIAALLLLIPLLKGLHD